jgi:hypothetical protein
MRRRVFALQLHFRSLSKDRLPPEIGHRRPSINVRFGEVARLRSTATMGAMRTDRSWPKADWQLPGDWKRKRTSDGLESNGTVRPIALKNFA